MDDKAKIRDVFSGVERSAIFSIALLSLIAGLFTLGIPIAAQTLINLIAFGKLLQPVVTLAIMVFVLMLALGALNIWQFVIIEVIQQRIMVTTSLDLTHQFTHFSLENFTSHHGPEMVNRFFEVVTIKKAISSLLLYGISLALQITLGLLLLLLYHPFFLVFDLMIILGILIIIFGPYKKARQSAKDECKEKHTIGAWLEEILINRILFRVHQYHKYASQQTDKKLVGFLRARNAHFRQLIKHQIGFYLLAALSSSLLFGMGGYLVINNQLSIGQLVAAEIVLGAFIYGFKRFGVLLENFYDLVASMDKLDEVLLLPTERLKEDLSELFLKINDIKISISNSKGKITKKTPLLIHIQDADMAKNVPEVMLGFRHLENFSVAVNGFECSKEHLLALRRHSLLITQPQWFVGSIYDNLVLNQKNISNKLILEKLKSLGLLEKILNLENGLKTCVYEWRSTFTHTEVIKLMILRALLFEPKLLVIGRALDYVNKEDTEQVLKEIRKLDNTLLVIITQNLTITNIENKLVI